MTPPPDPDFFDAEPSPVAVPDVPSSDDEPEAMDSEPAAPPAEEEAPPVPLDGVEDLRPPSEDEDEPEPADEEPASAHDDPPPPAPEFAAMPDFDEVMAERPVMIAGDVEVIPDLDDDIAEI